ncbi:hypothetical protein BKI52_22245 [marine bacterium AO1-C]|nr:hypothetical protein BKI52_22245 [marine bacterium AO1-C]
MSKLVTRKKGLVKFFFLFLLFMFIFNYPILSIFNTPEKIGSYPLLYVYIFIIWCITIACIAFVFERHPKHRPLNDSEENPE